MIRIIVPTTKVPAARVRDLRWRYAVEEVAEHVINGQVVALTWETTSPEVAYTQLNRLAGDLIGAFQVFTDAEEIEYIKALEDRYATA